MKFNFSDKVNIQERSIFSSSHNRFTLGCLVPTFDATRRRREEGLRISLIMITYNEEQYLPRALRNAAPFVDEILVLDRYSEDRTPEIASSYRAKVTQALWPDNYAIQRNRVLKQATGDWVLSMDADEEYNLIFLNSLRRIAANILNIDMCVLPRANFIDRKLDIRSFPDLQKRFWKNHTGIHYDETEKVHERPYGETHPAIMYDGLIIHRKTSGRYNERGQYYRTLGG